MPHISRQGFAHTRIRARHDRLIQKKLETAATYVGSIGKFQNITEIAFAFVNGIFRVAIAMKLSRANHQVYSLRER
jgi:hypothetical protein